MESENYIYALRQKLDEIGATKSLKVEKTFIFGYIFHTFYSILFFFSTQTNRAWKRKEKQISDVGVFA
jgi:hypothetical protein